MYVIGYNWIICELNDAIFVSEGTITLKSRDIWGGLDRLQRLRHKL